MIGADWSIFADAGLETNSNMASFSNSREDNSKRSGLIGSITHQRSYGGIHCDKVLCLVVNICRCYSANKVKFGNLSLFKGK